MYDSGTSGGHDREVPDDPDADRPGEDLSGRLLVASPRLGDPNFERTVVLVLDHGPHGALGVVLNRPTGLPVDEILDRWRDQAEATPPGVVFRGGPVSPDAVIGLVRTGAGTADAPSRLVLDGVGTVDLAVSPEDQPLPVDGVRMFAGYAGWSPEQLEDELGEGAWIVADAFASDIFTEAADALWHDVLQRQGGSVALLAAYPPHPSVN